MSVSTPRRGLVALGWLAYAIYYLGRVNFSVAVPALQSEKGLSGAEVGVLAAGFFWVYAVGGVLMGRMADRFGSRMLVAGGLLGSALANLAFGLSAAWAVLLVAWMFNGLFQSMGWSPLVGVLPKWLPAERVERVAVGLGSSFVVGSAVGLAAGGVLVDRTGVSGAFVVPALVMAAMAVIWLLVVRGDESRGTPQQDRAVERETIGGVIVRMRRLWPIVALVGLVYVALLVWTPLYLTDVHGMSHTQAGALSAIFASVGIVGSIGAGHWIGGSGSRPFRLGVILGMSALLLGLVPALDGSVVTAFAILTGSSILVAAGASVVLGSFAVAGPRSSVATVSGVLAMVFNLGGALGSPVIGRLVEVSSWTGVFAVLAGSMGAGALLLAISSRRSVPPKVAVDW